MNNKEKILINHLSIGYKTKKTLKNVLLENINLSVYEGDFICLLGPNGCGKSTLLSTISGIHKPIKGEILIDGKKLSEYERRYLAKKIAVVLTRNNSIANIPVYSIVSMGRFPHNNWLGLLNEQDLKIIDEVLESTDLNSFRNSNFLELSDGIKQKVMIARALVQDTQVILLDEPTAYLDIPSKLEIMHLLRMLAEQFNKSIVLSTHDLDLALSSADLIWLMTKDKKIVSDTPEDLVLNGEFERAFNKNEIEFLPHKGVFKINRSSNINLHVTGNEVEVLWTERALERIGISTAKDINSDNKLEISTRDEKNEWHLSINSTEMKFYSIKELLRYLKNIVA